MPRALEPVGKICTVVHGDDFLSVVNTIATQLVGHSAQSTFRRTCGTSCWPSEARRSEFRIFLEEADPVDVEGVHLESRSTARWEDCKHSTAMTRKHQSARLVQGARTSVAEWRPPTICSKRIKRDATKSYDAPSFCIFAADRFDFQHSAPMLMREMANARASDELKLKLFGTYLRRYPEMVEVYDYSSEEEANIYSEVDADWAGEELGRRSCVGVSSCVGNLSTVGEEFSKRW